MKYVDLDHQQQPSATVGPTLEDPNRHASIGTDAGATKTPKRFSITISTSTTTRHPTLAFLCP
jgi:hypothetical protein